MTNQNEILYDLPQLQDFQMNYGLMVWKAFGLPFPAILAAWVAVAVPTQVVING